jgi:hypothetical protein
MQGSQSLLLGAICLSAAVYTLNSWQEGGRTYKLSEPRPRPLPRRSLKTYVHNRKRDIDFGCITQDGWFSAAPDDLAVPRSIRTNNLGAINRSRSGWETIRTAFIGYSIPDDSGNVTTIWQTPEHGVAAWYYLLSDRYGYGHEGALTIRTLAPQYAGSNDPARTQPYIRGWVRWSEGAFTPDTQIHMNNMHQMTILARAMAGHEASQVTPVRRSQIIYGIELERRERLTPDAMGANPSS